MKLKKAFREAKRFDLIWYPERYATSHIKISGKMAREKCQPCYEDYLDQDGDGDQDGYEYYGDGGEIIASYYPNDKLLTLGC